MLLVDALYEARVQLFLASEASPQRVFEPILSGGAEMLAGAEVEVGGGGATRDAVPSFEEAPVGGQFRADGELAAFFTAKDESFMLRRTLSRLAEICPQVSATTDDDVLGGAGGPSGGGTKIEY